MICERHGGDSPLTYRSALLGEHSLCAPCISLRWPGTFTQGTPSQLYWRPHDLDVQVRYVSDGDAGAGGDKL